MDEESKERERKKNVNWILVYVFFMNDEDWGGERGGCVEVKEEKIKKKYGENGNWVEEINNKNKKKINKQLERREI